MNRRTVHGKCSYADAPYGTHLWSAPILTRHHGFMSATAPQRPGSVNTFSQLLSSTRRGARLARLLATEQLHAWPVPPSVTERAEQIVAELAANAVLHGHVNSRDSGSPSPSTPRLACSVSPSPTLGGERIPSLPAECGTPVDTESGRGLLLVTALADRWGVEPYPPSGKTVWAECACETLGPGPSAGGSDRDGQARFTGHTAGGLNTAVRHGR